MRNKSSQGKYVYHIHVFSGISLCPGIGDTVFLKFFNNFISQRWTKFWQYLNKSICGYPIILPAGIFLFKSELSYLLKEVFNIRRRKSGCHRDNEIQINVFRMELGQVMFQNRSPSLFVQTTNRYDAIKPSRTKQRGIQLTDIVGGTHEQHLVLLIFEQRNLFKKFMGNGLVNP